MPEGVEVEFVPEVEGEPAGAELPGMLQGHFVQPNFHDGNFELGEFFSVIGEEGELGGRVVRRRFIESGDCVYPSGVLNVVEFAEIEEMFLGGLTVWQATIFDDRPVAMGFSVLVAGAFA